MNSTERQAQGEHWSLRRRLIGWVAAIVGMALLLGGVLVDWVMEDSLRRELDGLAVEEVAELTVRILQSPLDESRLVSVANALDHEHPEIWLSLRAWREHDEQPWVVAGAPARLPWPESAPVSDGVTTRPERVYRLRSETVLARVRGPGSALSVEPLKVELMVDGQPRADELARTRRLCLIAALIAGILGILGGVLFSQRLSRLLQQVAQSATAARLDEAADVRPPPRAPEEILKVVEAFRGSVRAMRAEHSRNVLLTAGLAHELRSPLQNLISDAEVSLLRERDGEEYRDLVSRQLDELRDLALVVDNLITLTALRDTQRLTRQEAFDFGAEIKMRISQELREAERRNVRIEIREHGDVELRGDREALVLMLRNLIKNAVRWTAPGTTVRTTLDGRSEHLVVSVEDEGRGVETSERESIFDAFYQGSTPSGSRAGYGLGLALARTAARSHGGEIEVGDTETGGARFVVRLPREGEGRAAPISNGRPHLRPRSADERGSMV